jgi:hypothetical protein
MATPMSAVYSANAGGLRAGHGLVRLRARRIDHADEPRKTSSCPTRSSSSSSLTPSFGSDRNATPQRSQRLAGQLIVRRHDLGPQCRGEPPRRLAGQLLGTARQQDIRRALLSQRRRGGSGRTSRQ